MLAVKNGTEAASQRSDLMLCVGNRVEDDLRVDVSDAGLLPIGGMFAILLSVAVLVGAAARNRFPQLINQLDY